MKRKKLDRINELAKKAKSSAGLSAAEIAERETLRAEYLAAIRENFRKTLDSVKFVDKETETK